MIINTLEKYLDEDKEGLESFFGLRQINFYLKKEMIFIG